MTVVGVISGIVGCLGLICLLIGGMLVHTKALYDANTRGDYEC